MEMSLQELKTALLGSTGEETLTILKEINAWADRAIRSLRQAKKEVKMASAEQIAVVEKSAVAEVEAKGEPTPIAEPKNDPAIEVFLGNTEIGQRLVALNAVAAVNAFTEGGPLSGVEPGNIVPIGIEELEFYFNKVDRFLDQHGNWINIGKGRDGLDIYQLWRKHTPEAVALKEHPQILIFPNEEGDGCDIFGITSENCMQVKEMRDVARDRKKAPSVVKKLSQEEVRKALSCGDLE